MTDYKTIVVADAGPVRTITLHRPERRNAMSIEMQVELISAIENSATSGSQVLVLTGWGDAFCSGLDLSELKSARDKTVSDHRADAERIARLLLVLYELPIPTIAAVHGPAIAGGTGLAMICDFTLATPDAKFGFTEVRIGFVPAIVSAFLALQIGRKQSIDLLLTGRIFDAEEAHRLGLVSHVVPRDELAEHVRALADTLLANSPQALKATKRMVTQQSLQWVKSAIANGIEESTQARMTGDFREGVAAFLEKRKPAWTE